MVSGGRVQVWSFSLSLHPFALPFGVRVGCSLYRVCPYSQDTQDTQELTRGRLGRGYIQSWMGKGEGERVHRFAVVCMVMLYTPPLLCGLREAMGLIIGLGAGWFPRAWDRGSEVPFKRFNGVVG